MLERMSRAPKRVLMTIDAVGGVWRYGMALGRSLGEQGVDIAWLCLGPAPSAAQRREAEAIGTLFVRDLPLDWMVRAEAELDGVGRRIEEVAGQFGAELLHLNLPSQAAALSGELPVVAVAHSCVPSWFRVVRGSGLPAGWAWHEGLNRRGLLRADVAVAPSRSHAALTEECYGPLDHLVVVPNAASPEIGPGPKAPPFVLAAGRWWDEGKNAAVLDAAAGATQWPILAAGPTRGPGGAEFVFRHARPLGERDYRTVAGLMARAAIFVSPSLYEPFGLAALEAAQAGAALVVADIPTYRELWEGVALFVAPEDAKGFALAIDRLIDDPELRTGLAEAGRGRAGRLTPELQAEAMLAAYAAATARARTRTVIEV